MKRILVDNDGLTPEETKKVEEEYYEYYNDVIKAKDPLDYRFDEEFDTAIDCMYYEAEACCAMFTVIEFHFNNLYRYFQYTKRFVAAHEKMSNTHYDKLALEAESEEEAEYAEMQSNLAPGEELTLLTCQSILLMIYSVFEAFLRDIIDYVGDDEDILKYPADDFTAAKYIQYLNKQDIFIPKELYWKFDEVRLVRNYFAHSLEKPQARLLKYLRNDPDGILKGSSIRLNPNYIEHIFELFGKMVDSIEGTFIEIYGIF